MYDTDRVLFKFLDEFVYSLKLVPDKEVLLEFDLNSGETTIMEPDNMNSNNRENISSQ